MKTTLPALLTLLLLSAVVLSPLTTKGQDLTRTPRLTLDQNEVADADTDDNDSDEDDEPVQRVARITFIEGDVSFLRAGVSEWSEVAENLPLLTGDQIYVGGKGRVEIQFGRGNYVRLSEKTSLTITELSQTEALLEVTEGIAIIRLERYGSAWERFEVDTPNSALVLKQDGLYRVNVRGKDDSEVIIRRGLAEVFSDDGNFKVREGQRLTIDTSPNGRLQIAIDNSNDEWDRWTYDRDRQVDYLSVSTAPDYVRQYETDYDSFYGASDLTNYGSWTSYSGYGNCWVPRVSTGWAPYRSGQWLWIPRAGWTWLSNEPWGWAPYHYGRWVYLNNIGWAWAPGFNTNRYRYGHSYYQWRPALVAFFNCPTSRGNYIGWYPLSPGQRWRRSGNFGGDGFRGNNGRRHIQYPVAGNGNRRPNGGGNGFGNGGGRPRVGNGNGVTVLPVEGFAGQGRTKFKPNAPTPEVSHSFTKGARPGLPDLGNNTNSFINTKVAKPGDPSNGLRAVVKPPQEIFNRGVVTRQRTTETQAETVAPRERRFIETPGPKQYGNEVPNNKRGRRGEDIGGGNTRGGETTTGGTSYGNKPGAKNPYGNSSGGSVNNGSSSTANGNGRIITDESIKKRTRGSGEETVETRKTDASGNGDNSPTWKTRDRTTTVNQGQDQSDSSAKKRERANQNNDGSTTPGDANKRVYVPREKPQEESSDVEERRREKQQRRQQQQQDQQQQQQQEQQRREEQERQQRRAERQEAEKQQQQQQEQERQQRRAERQQQEQQQQEQQRREQQQQEQRRAEKEQQQQQEQQRREEQQQQQRREEKQQRKKGDN